jgi:hypothetical protein
MTTVVIFGVVVLSGYTGPKKYLKKISNFFENSAKGGIFDLKILCQFPDLFYTFQPLVEFVPPFQRL